MTRSPREKKREAAGAAREKAGHKREAALERENDGLSTRLLWCHGMLKRVLSGWFKPNPKIIPKITRKR